MADSVLNLGKNVKNTFDNAPLVKSIKNHDDPISIITQAINRVKMISNVTLQSINGQEEMEGYTGRRFARAGRGSLKEFIDKVKTYGTSIKAKYEVTFSGIDNLTFFVTDINVPSVRRNFGILHYRGQTLEVPVTIEYEHDFNMTVINDGQGVLYPTFVNLLLNMKEKSAIDSGYDMTVRIFGDGLNNAGIAIVLFGVRFKTISGITMNSGDTGVSTFTVGCTAIKYDVLAETVQTNLLKDEVKNRIASIQINSNNSIAGVTSRIG